MAELRYVAALELRSFEDLDVDVHELLRELPRSLDVHQLAALALKHDIVTGLSGVEWLREIYRRLRDSSLID